MQPINVYLPYIWDYQHFEHLWEKSLYQIGIRAGLIQDSPQEQVSKNDQERVVSWLNETFNINLLDLAKSKKQRESNNLASLVTWTGALVIGLATITLLFADVMHQASRIKSDSRKLAEVEALDQRDQSKVIVSVQRLKEIVTQQPKKTACTK